MDLHLPSKGNPNQQRYVPQKDSQNRKLLWESLVEGNPPPYSDLKMTSHGPGSVGGLGAAVAGLPFHPALRYHPSKDGFLPGVGCTSEAGLRPVSRA
ncbi:hypothetical protein E2C01_098085 [Portunus trituberculatus]|uniref:Uncharacterized protein n=1 Tax=Portunus trituberculatus TaxID=210409 RepID=A0A5B7KB93_PORTR|nr:hypothetical protein [Portunus trituberculatus]